MKQPSGQLCQPAFASHTPLVPCGLCGGAGRQAGRRGAGSEGLGDRAWLVIPREYAPSLRSGTLGLGASVLQSNGGREENVAGKPGWRRGGEGLRTRGAVGDELYISHLLMVALHDSLGGNPQTCLIELYSANLVTFCILFYNRIFFVVQK